MREIGVCMCVCDTFDICIKTSPKYPNTPSITNGTSAPNTTDTTNGTNGAFYTNTTDVTFYTNYANILIIGIRRYIRRYSDIPILAVYNRLESIMYRV